MRSVLCTSVEHRDHQYALEWAMGRAAGDPVGSASRHLAGERRIGEGWTVSVSQVGI